MAIGRHSSIVDTHTYLPIYLHPSYFILRGRPYKETVTDAMYLYLQIKPFHIYTYIYDPTPFHLTYDTLQQTGKCLSVDSTGRRRMVRCSTLTFDHALTSQRALEATWVNSEKSTRAPLCETPPVDLEDSPSSLTQTCQVLTRLWDKSTTSTASR